MSVALNIADLFEHAVNAAPAKPALKAGGRVMTFGELESDANRLAHFLSAAASGREGAVPAGAGTRARS
jgi:3-oxocholest-4-en-26-oate---CoA ligase